MFDAGAIISTLTLDRDPFQAGLDWGRAEGRKFAKEKWEAKLGLNTLQAKADLDALKAALTALTGRSVDLDVQIDGALAKIATLQAALDGLRAPDLRIELDGTEELQARIRALRLELEQLSGTTARPDIELSGDEAALARIRQLQEELDRLGASSARPDVDVNDRGGAARASQGVSMLMTGLLTLAPIAAPVGAAVAAALAAIPTGAAIALGGIAALAAGLSGIGAAYKAMQADQKAVASGAVAAGAATAAATQQIAAAERGLAQARDNATDASARAAKQVLDARRAAERGVSQALASQRSAETNYTAAVRDAERAQEALTDARKAARRTLEDLQFQTAGGALAERRAVLQLQDAEQALRQGRAAGAGGRQLEELTLSYEEAKLSVDELRLRNARLADDKADADRRGVDGSRQVVAATEQVSSANQRVADADRARGEAAAAVAEAQREGSERMAEALANQERTARQNAYSLASAQDALTSAQRSLAQAAGATSATALKAKETMAELTPQGRAFVQFLDAQMKPAIKAIKAEAQANLLPGLQAGMEAALPVLPEVTGLIGSLAKEVGNLGERSGRALGSDPFWRQYIGFLKAEAGPTISQFGTISGNSIKALAGISQGALPIWRMMGDGLERMTGRWAAFGVQAASGQNQKFNEFLAYVERTGPKVVAFFGDLGSLIVNVGQAVAPAGTLLMDFIGGVADFVDSIPTPVLQTIGVTLWGISAALFALGPVKIVLGLVAVGVAGLAAAVVALGAAAGSAGLVGLGARLASLAAFMTGPWGIAIGLATAALGFLWVAHDQGSEAAEAQAAAETSFKDALVASKGAIDDSVRSATQKAIADAKVAATLEDGASVMQLSEINQRKLIDTTDALGISQAELTDAVIAGGKPLDALKDKLLAAAEANSTTSTVAGVTTKTYNDQGLALLGAARTVDEMSGAFRRQQDESVKTRAAINGITVEQQKLRDSLLATNDALMASIGADLSKEQTAQRVESAQKRLADAIRDSGAGSLEARTAATDLEQTYISLITQSGEAAAKQAKLRGETDTTKASLDAQNAKTLELAASMTGPLPAALQRLIDGMTISQLTAAGATVKIDETGRAVATLPGGRTIEIKAENTQALAAIAAVNKALGGLAVPAGVGLFGAAANLGRSVTQRAGGGSGGGVVYPIPRFGAGGVIGGYAPGRDTVPAMLSPGESVLVPELTREIGPAAIMAANYRASGRAGTVWSGGSGGGVALFAGGGVIPPASGAPAASPDGRAGIWGDGAALDPATIAAAAEATTSLTEAQAQLLPQVQATTGAQQQLTPAVDAATLAQQAQTAAQQQLTALGVLPTTAAMTGLLFPAMVEQARLAGEVDVAAVNALRDAHTPLQQQLGLTAQVTADTMASNNAQVTGFDDLGRFALGSVRTQLDLTRAAMTATADWTAVQFGAMRARAADPIRWIMTGPLGDAGLVGAWNSLDAQFAMGRRIAAFPPGFAQGGPISGAGTSTSDSIPAMLSDGEFVIRAGVAQRVPHFLTALNSGQPEAMQAAGAGRVADTALRLASGGPVTDALARAAKVASAMNGKPYIWGGAGPNGADCSGYQSIITNSLRGEANPYRRIGTTATFPWGGFASGLGGAYAIGAFKGNPGHMAGTLNLAGMAGGGAVNVEAGGSPSRVKFGAGAVGADNAQFGIRGWLPSVGGKFVSGGAGGGVFDVGPIIDEALAATRGLIGQIPALFGAGEPAARGAGVATAAVDAARTKAVTDLGAMFASSGGGGGNVEAYRGVVNQALTMMGQPLALAGSTLRRMNQESGGNPTAVNRWDVNWLAGHPSVGLMQVIGPTYAANRPSPDTGPYLYGVSTNPLSNILASMKYALRRYGSLSAAYDKAGGYDNGGPLLDDGIALNTSGRTENVLSAAQGDALTERLRGDDRRGAVDIVALVDRMTDRIVAALADMVPVNVFPREQQSEESIGAAVDNRRRRRSRTL